MCPYPASEVNFLQNLPLISVSTFTLSCPQLSAQVLVRLPESSTTPSATGTLPLPSSGPAYCSWTHPHPAWGTIPPGRSRIQLGAPSHPDTAASSLGHHPTFLRSLLLSCVKVILLHLPPQPTQPNPTPADPSLPSFSIPLYYLLFFMALLWPGIKLHISFLSSVPTTPPQARTRMEVLQRTGPWSHPPFISSNL